MQLNEIELKIVEARLNGESFCEMNTANSRAAVDQIMIRGCAICGGQLPQTEFFASFIADEIIAFLLEHGCKGLTLAEILLALRLNEKQKFPPGIDIEQITFTGTCFNVSYFAKVIFNYKVIRDLLDRKFQNLIEGHAQ